LMRNDEEFNAWYSDKMEELFGPPRKEESELTDRDMDLAHSVQVLLEERAFQLLNDLHELHPSDNLCLAGGVALNSTMNGKIRQFTPFKNVFIIPAANDAGLSLGAALYCNAVESPSTFVRHHLDHAYYGSHHTDPEIEAELKDLPPSIKVSKPDNLVQETAKLLNEYNIVGWYQGRMEFGPRALGNRSILANPTKAETKDIVNQKVKFRENFRPFAPMVPLEFVGDYFESDEEMPFMLKIVEVKPEKRSVIPAVTHVDHTARVQTVTPQQNERIHKLLHEMKKLGGVPVLLNTSFNIRGDTIVRTPKDAVKCLLQTGLNALAIGPYLLVKTQ
ncbi:MAG: carbamoyltransferase, partial [Cyanobacteria bacterium]|nr:carbamoyltransferase [Cyanobacteriota bacterium]